MTVKNVSNLAASVQARLQNHARATKRPFQELLQYYAMERFLYRLSTTSHRALRPQGRADAARVGGPARARDEGRRLPRPTRQLAREPRARDARGLRRRRGARRHGVRPGHGEDRAHQGGRGLRGRARPLRRPARQGARDDADRCRVRRRRDAWRVGYRVSGAARLPRTRALGLPARDRDRGEVPSDGLPAHAEQPHEGLLRCAAGETFEQRWPPGGPWTSGA